MSQLYLHTAHTHKQAQRQVLCKHIHTQSIALPLNHKINNTTWFLNLTAHWHRNIKSNKKWLCSTKVCIRVCVLPPVVRQVLLQLCYPVEFVEEPLIYGRQLVDLIYTHTTVEGLKRKQTQCYIYHSSSSSSSSLVPLIGAFWKQTWRR